MTASFHQYARADLMADAAAERLAAALGEALADKPRAVLAAAGGSTPGPLLGRLAMAALDWPKVRVVPTDDRLVDEDHPARNARMIRLRLSALMEAGLEVASLEEVGDSLRPDVVLLGFGGDQHVASIFPAGEGMAAARAPDAPDVLRTTPEPLPAEAPFSRITLSLPAILGARLVLVAATGAAKREAYEAARDARPPTTPLAAVLGDDAANVEVYWSP